MRMSGSAYDWLRIGWCGRVVVGWTAGRRERTDEASLDTADSLRQLEHVSNRGRVEKFVLHSEQIIG